MSDYPQYGGQYPQQPPPGPPPQYQGQYPQQPHPGQYAQQPQYPGPQPGYPYAPPQPLPAYNYASWGARVGAYLIDFLIFGVVPMALSMVGMVDTMRELFDKIDDCPAGDSACVQESYDPMSFYSEPLTLLAMVLGIGGFLLMAYLEGKSGQTPGRKALGIKLIREREGVPVGFGLAIGRRICHMADGMACYIGYLWPLWDDKKQTFADKMVSTVVIRER